MRLILTRHGETEENKNKIIQGHLPGNLSESGIEQAKKVSERLKSEKIDYIYSSDLKRAADTAKEIAKNHPETKIRFVENLREIDFGDWTGKTYSEVDFKTVPDNSEPAQKLQDRMYDFIEELYKIHKNQRILLVSHGGSISTVLAKLLDRPAEDLFEIRLGNTAINEIEVTEDKNHILHLMNCTKHLE